jgi:pimeloyl-ACP methyl ester carboxylesterase
MTLSLGLLLICILALSCLAATFFKEQESALAQPFIQTIKHRNIVIDLGNGVKTNAQLAYPAIGKGQFPGVLLIPGTGAVDMNSTLANNARPFWQIANYLSERGFAVLRYDKRGIGTNHTILDTNVWGNATVNDLIHDAEKALNVLLQQPEVDPKRISIIGHSEGTVIAPRVAIDNSTKVKNIVLMGTVAQNLIRDILLYQVVYLRSEYATQVLDKNHTGLISVQQITKDPLLDDVLTGSSILKANNDNNVLTKEFGNKGNSSGYLSIDRQLTPLLINEYENETAFNLSKCNNIIGCPIWFRSESNLEPNLSIIGNVSKCTSILILNGENDTQTPVQQALLLQQRLTEVNHPDHTLITYPNLGHLFYPSSEWQISFGPIQPYVLADLYSWLEAHSGFTRLPSSMPSTYTSSSSNSTTTIK